MGWNPEKEVSSLELCRRLKELSYPQDGGGWYWIKTAFGWILAIMLDGIWLSERNYIKVNDETIKDFVKAPTCRELPLNLYWCNKCLSFNVEKKKLENSEYAFYICRDCGHRFRMKEIRFLVHPKTQCWIWLGAVNKDGYGHFKQRGKIIDAHKGRRL